MDGGGARRLGLGPACSSARKLITGMLDWLGNLAEKSTDDAQHPLLGSAVLPLQLANSVAAAMCEAVRGQLLLLPLLESTGGGGTGIGTSIGTGSGLSATTATPVQATCQHLAQCIRFLTHVLVHASQRQHAVPPDDAEEQLLRRVDQQFAELEATLAQLATAVCLLLHRCQLACQAQQPHLMRALLCITDSCSALLAATELLKASACGIAFCLGRRQEHATPAEDRWAVATQHIRSALCITVRCAAVFTSSRPAINRQAYPVPLLQALLTRKPGPP